MSTRGPMLQFVLLFLFFPSVTVSSMGIKERKIKILLGLLLFSNDSLSAVELTSTVQYALDLTLNQKTKTTLSHLVKEGVIEKSEGDNLSYTLTERGLNELYLEFPFFRFLKTTWDGKWRVLSYEIPEKKRELRDRLRRVVAGWGLGPWHRSFWLTPHPIVPNLRQLVSQKEEEKYIQAFEADHVFGEREILIEKVWSTKEIDTQYRTLFKKWHDILAGDESKQKKLALVLTEYVTLLRIDPGLPKELVGEQWIGFEAFSIFKEIRSILLA